MVLFEELGMLKIKCIKIGYMMDVEVFIDLFVKSLYLFFEVLLCYCDVLWFW